MRQIPMTEPVVSSMLLTGLDTGLGTFSSERSPSFRGPRCNSMTGPSRRGFPASELTPHGQHARASDPTVTPATSHLSARPIRAAAAAAILLLLTSCNPAPKAVVTVAGSCEAFRPAFPISYDSTKDSAQTVRGVRQANARFQSACG